MYSSNVRFAPNPIVWRDPQRALSPSAGASVASASTTATTPKSNARTQIFYDGLHQMCIRLTNGQLYSATPSNPSWMEYPISISTTEPIAGIAFSANQQLIAVATPTNVRIFEAKSGQLHSTKPVSSKSVSIQGIHWLSPPDALLLVTSAGLELYQLMHELPKNSYFLKLVKSSQYSNTVNHWFLDSTSTALLIDQKGVFQSYKVRPNNIIRICKFELDNSAKIVSNPSQIALVCLYAKLYCAYVNEQKGQLFLLALAKDSMKQANQYDLFTPGKYMISTVDNVLIVHNLAAKVVLMFDVRSDPASHISVPLPISSRAAADFERRRSERKGPLSTDLKDKLAVDDLSQSAEAASSSTVSRPLWEQSFQGVPAHFYDSWQFFSPRFILDSADMSCGIFWALELDLPDIAATWPSSTRERLVDFLLKRGSAHSKTIILNTIEALVRSEGTLPLLSKLFNMLNRIVKVEQDQQAQVQNAATDSEKKDEDMSIFEAQVNAPTLSSLGYVIVSQQDMYENVFQPCKSKMSARALAPIVMEYLRSVAQLSLPTEFPSQDLLVDLMIEDEKYYDLHQFLQYHILRDSLPFAKRLIDIGETVYQPARQLGLDMLFRLGAFADLLRILLAKREVLHALRLVSHRSLLFKEQGLNPADFLEAALVCGSTTVFYAAYKFFETRNVMLRNVPAFAPDDKCEKYVIHYNHLFGPGG